ncbi:MAG: hypothetical protein IT306_20980 [Chloroflexi bacterium]|nr:hypothetical protein [Chloroflexota bacterium]
MNMRTRALVWGRDRLFLSVAVLTAAWLSFEYLLLGPYSWMYGYGASLETIPVHLGLARSGSTWSLWAPFVAGGLDRLSFWGNADPFNVEPLLFTFLPTWLANGLHVFAQRVVAVYFTARVCADQLRLSKRWCVLAALVHAGLGYFTVGEMFAFASVPLLIWLLSWIDARRRWWLLAPAAGALFSTLVTFSQSAPYLFVFAVGWSALVLARRHGRPYLVIGLFFVGLTVVELPQTLAALANAPFSHRAAFALEPVSVSIPGLFYYQLQFDFLDQDKLLRGIAIALAPAALVGGVGIVLLRRSSKREATLLLRIALLYLLLSLKVAWIAAQALTMMALPWVAGLYMGRFYTLPAAFMISVLTALAANVLVHEMRPALLRRAPLVALVGAVAVLLIWPKASLYYPLMVDGWGEKHYQAPALEELRRSDTSIYRVASVLDLQPAYAYGQGFETADGWSNLYPSVYRDVWLRIIAPLMEKVPATRAVFDPPDGRPQDHYIFLGLSLGLAPIGLLPGEDPIAALQAGFDFDARFNVRLLSMLNVKYVFSRFPLQGEGLQLVHAPARPPRLIDNHDYATGLVNAPTTRFERVVLTEIPGRVVADGLQAIERKREGKDLYIYENRNVLPRFRAVSRIEVLPSGKGVLDRLEAMTLEELRSSAIVERASDTANALANAAGALTVGNMRVTCYAPDGIALSSSADGATFLVVGNTWNPAWVATIDGVPAALVRANHAQMGLLVPPGDHAIRLRYAPWYGAHLTFLSGFLAERCD